MKMFKYNDLGVLVCVCVCVCVYLCVSHTCHTLHSVQASLLHDAQEFLLVHFPVSIPVCFVDHLLWRRRPQEGLETSTIIGWTILIVALE